jgi:phosphoesterase RecJ-like protein
MIKRVVADEVLQQLKLMLMAAQKIVITCHVSPDGDAVGSSLCLMHVLRKLGKQATVITPDMLPPSLTFLPGVKDIVVYTRQELMAKHFVNEADMIVCLDFNAPYRVDRFAPVLTAAKAKKVLIDHHLDPEPFADLQISFPEMSSTCELLYHVIYFMGMKRYMSRWSATCLYTGMMTDTGNFTYNSNNPDLYVIISELLKWGIDKEHIYNVVMNTNSENRLRLLGYALSEKMEVFPEVGGALITLDHDELVKYHYQRGDTESLVNRPLTIPGVYWSIFLRDDQEYIKVSTRSAGDFAVNVWCEKYFCGGGHKNAAGGEFRGTMDECKAIVYDIVELLKKEKENKNEK